MINVTENENASESLEGIEAKVRCVRNLPWKGDTIGSQRVFCEALKESTSITVSYPS